ncbi:disease resistance protein RGA5-like isoform X2 [Lolium rigidum]|uniref:disease resistance protein RGA5-like isoform X2 n=1 Tax=Lolium rigidum TaxID=89674 RepID=UPI001F5C16CD|nr:disease resistance protein RGA5-like isoform X2 [Lolium rigidum]
MEGALVSVAAGALKPVLEKLATLLGDEYKRLRRVHEGIEFLTQELSFMEAFFVKMSTEEDPDVQVKLWMTEVRELSYDIEDSLDDFIEHAHDKSSKPGFMKKIKNLLDRTKATHKIAKAIEELKKQITEASERHKRYAIGDSISKVNNVTIDRRALAIFEDVSNLVGIDGPKNELLQLFNQEIRCESRHQQPKMISIVGFGGLGKTTLARQVYEELKEHFDCHAFVSVSQHPILKEVLGTIFTELCKSRSKRRKNKGQSLPLSSIEDVPQLISRILDFLADTRYFIVVDDIWNEEIWDVVKLAFPRNGYDCRIITTTRVINVAQSCRSSFNGHIYNMDPLSMVHSRQLFHKRLFNSEECPTHLEEVSSQILKKCAGLPLAVIAISGLLSNKEKTKDQWCQVESSIGRGLERNPTIEAMLKIISISYFDLPPHLKTCLLYLSIFPEDSFIEKKMLIRRWIAEGFIQKKHGYTHYEAGEMCFNELVNRSLIQPRLEKDKWDEVIVCRVHDTILEFIVFKSIEENFVTIIGVPGVNSDQHKKVRRLSVQNSGEIPVGLNLSAARSLSIFGNDVKVPSLLEFKHLRVLGFEYCKQVQDHHLADIVQHAVGWRNGTPRRLGEATELKF